MSKPSIIRQVKDLQAQAERLIRTGGNMPEIEAFANYNEEIKTFLLNTIQDEFVLNYIKTIPSIDIDAIETKSGIRSIALGLFFGGTSTIYHEKNKIESALKQIKDISNKYSSYEIMIKNHFQN